MLNKMAISKFWFVDHLVDTMTPGEKKKKIFYSRVLWYAESDGVIFVKILRLLGGVSPYFLK